MEPLRVGGPNLKQSARRPRGAAGAFSALVRFQYRKIAKTLPLQEPPIKACPSLAEALCSFFLVGRIGKISNKTPPTSALLVFNGGKLRLWGPPKSKNKVKLEILFFFFFVFGFETSGSKIKQSPSRVSPFLPPPPPFSHPRPFQTCFLFLSLFPLPPPLAVRLVFCPGVQCGWWHICKKGSAPTRAFPRPPLFFPPSPMKNSPPPAKNPRRPWFFGGKPFFAHGSRKIKPKALSPNEPEIEGGREKQRLLDSSGFFSKKDLSRSPWEPGLGIKKQCFW